MLVDTATLAQHLDDPDWVIFDCRHDLMDPEKGERLYREGHLPGAHFASIDHDLSAERNGTNGRHPLPSPAAVAAFLARHGAHEGSTVIAYDDAGGQFAARLWWLARWIGLARVGLLDGGSAKWVAEGRALTRNVAHPTPGVLRARPDAGMVWSAAQVLAHLNDPRFRLIDARAPERFRGEVEPIDPVAGHIPGALNHFNKNNLNPDLTFRPVAELRAAFEPLIAGAEYVVHQCGSGVTACLNIFAMEHAGLHGSKLYAGSWSEWIADPMRPVITREGS
jgi:thiosulfate/3-mercaptopyruvate sulfurtransferase